MMANKVIVTQDNDRKKKMTIVCMMIIQTLWQEYCWHTLPMLGESACIKNGNDDTE